MAFGMFSWLRASQSSLHSRKKMALCQKCPAINKIFAKQNWVPKYTSTYIHTDLNWSSQPKSGLEMPQLSQTPPLRDQFGQLGAPEGLSGYDLASQ